MSMMVSFVLSFFPRDVLDEILNLIESVSEDFLTTLLYDKRVITWDFRHHPIYQPSTNIGPRALESRADKSADNEKNM